MVEREPDIENVVYMDEYPHIDERLRLRRLARPALLPVQHDNLLIFERTTPDEEEMPVRQ